MVDNANIVSTNEPQKHYFYTLPYINLGDVTEIDLGFAKIWNYDQMKKTYLPDTKLREHIDKILRNYRMSYPNNQKDGFEAYPPIHGIGIIYIGNKTTKQFDTNDNQKMNDARMIVFFSQLARRNTITRNVNAGHLMISSENYIASIFSAVVGSEHMSEQSGFVVPMMHGGLKIDENIYIRPKEVLTPSFEIDKELFNALIKMRLKHKRAFRKIISAIEVFYESYYNSAHLSHNARILLQASAFEILLDTTTNNARIAMKDFLRREADYPEDRRYRYMSERSKDGKKKVQEIETKRVMWADRFFTLRNHIIHGQVPREKEYYFGAWQSHFDIALYFFVFLVKRDIEKDLRKDTFNDDVVWKTWTDDLRVTPVKLTGFKYNTYGKREWEKIMAKINKKRNKK